MRYPGMGRLILNAVGFGANCSGVQREVGSILNFIIGLSLVSVLQEVVTSRVC